MFTTVKKIHFVGIGGIGMSGIAEILLNQGFEITGSDVQRGENVKYLEKKGIKIFIGHENRYLDFLLRSTSVIVPGLMVTSRFLPGRVILILDDLTEVLRKNHWSFPV